MAVIESYLQDACRAIYQRAHPHLIILSLCRVGYLHRELTENVLVWVFVPGIIVEGPPKFPVSLAAGAILNCGNPICGHDAFIKDPFGNQGCLVLARSDLAGSAGDVQTFQRDGD